jgi:hypothetical protein
MERAERIHGKLQVSGILVMLGLLVEAICLLWSRPIAFVIFASLGGLLIAAGVLFFLYSLVSSSSSKQIHDN